MISGLARLAARRRLAQWRARAASPARIQEELLLRWIARARDTAFGREHGFAGIRRAADYRKAVPLRSYEGFRDLWRQAMDGTLDVTWPGRIEYWAVSSGTTSGEKYLPVSRDTIRGNRGGGFDSLVPILVKEDSRLFEGKLLFLGGATALRRSGPSWIGDNTGIMARHVPRLLRRFHAPGYEIAAEPRWDVKIERAARATVKADVRLLAGVPSWLLVFAEAVLRAARAAGRRADSLADVWPHWTAVVHGGVVFEPYRRRFLELAGKPLTTVDTYSASEGGMLAVQTGPPEEGMLPIVDRCAVFEFVPFEELGHPDPRRFFLHEVEPGVDYAVVLTTNSGLWGYAIGDLVRFTSIAPPRLLFAGRTAHTLNAFGEHVCGGEIDRAVAAAANALDLRIGEFAVGVEYPTSVDPRGRHVYFVEMEFPDGARAAELAEGFASALDATLARGNEDYAAHRRNDAGLEAPRVRPVPPGTFLRWMEGRGKLGGQNKVPRVLTPELHAEFAGAASRPISL